MQNIVLITVDSLREDHVGYHGYPEDTTPTIDKLANGGADFSNAFAHACSTRPSFPSILTSVYARMYGGYERVSEEQTVIAEPLSEAGYETAAFHSNLYLSADFGYDAGFDQFFDSKADADPSLIDRIKDTVRSTLDEDGLLFRSLSNFIQTTEQQVGLSFGLAYVPAAELTDMAIEWVWERAATDNFLWIHYMDVHHPYVPPAEYQRPFREDPISQRRAIKLRRKMIESPESITDKEIDDLVNLYDAEIRYTDAQIRRLLKAIDDQWAETTVVLTADHGEEFHDHGGFSHSATFYDEVMNVPLVVDGPGIGGTYDELIGLIDLAPTLLDYADLPIPDTYRGNSLRALFQDGDWSREIVIGDWMDLGSWEERLAVRTSGWKYIISQSSKELYDLTSDPGEQENVVEEHPAVVDELEAVLDDHRADVKTTYRDLGTVEMDESVKKRLRDLGYKE